MEKMWKTKGGVYVVALLMLFMILIINANPSRATSIVMKMSSNNSAGSGCSSIHDCPIADHQSLEFLLGPEMATATTVAVKALIQAQPVVNCGRGIPHTTCLPGSQSAKAGENCYDTYHQPTHNRGCSY